MPSACSIVAALALGFAALQAPAQKFVPAVVAASDLTIKLEPAGRMPAGRNVTSPVAAGSTLLLVDQGGAILKWSGSEAITPVFGPADTPRGLKLAGPERILNVAAHPSGTIVYVMFISSAAPPAIPRRLSPRDPDAWYVLYEFAFDGDQLSAPRPITALQVRTEGHTGGGLAVLPDGAVLFAPGDNGDSYEDGREYSQDPSVHLSKLIRIDVKTGATDVVAIGVRAAQRVVVTGSGSAARVSFVDPGGWVAEELNSFPVSELVPGPKPVNFGWGRAADGRSREGTFYLDRLGNSTGIVGDNDDDFRAPVASFGREKATAVAVSGPVAGGPSFTRITALFGDLVSGDIFAVTEPLDRTGQPVLRTSVVNERGESVTLRALAAGERPDPRFFTFPDGTAGVLLERTGLFYRVTEEGRSSGPGVRRP